MVFIALNPRSVQGLSIRWGEVDLDAASNRRNGPVLATPMLPWRIDQENRMSLMAEHLFSAGYVLVRAGDHDVHTLRNELLKVDGVRIAHALIGPEDLICYVETYDAARFRKALNHGIRHLITTGHIERTETMVILSDKGKGYSGRENTPAPAAAWLLCDVSVNDPETVIDELMTKKGVVNAHPVLGRCDMIAYVEAASMDELLRILDDDIRHVKGIRSTDTRLVLTNLAEEVAERNNGRKSGI
jgi:DNA-binding Lrp family transcriptional regulator